MLKYLFILLFCASPTFAQWGTYKLKDDKNTNLLEDVLAHCENPKNFYDADKVTWAHEASHGVNNQLRNKYKSPCFYVLGSRYFKMPESNITLKILANNIPKHLKYENYNLYVIASAAHYNNQPSYIVDELTCYMNGLCVADELKQTKRIDDCFNRSLEMLGYIIILKLSSEKNNNLNEYIEWCWLRLEYYKEISIKNKQWTSELEKRWSNLLPFRNKSSKSYL